MNRIAHATLAPSLLLLALASAGWGADSDDHDAKPAKAGEKPAAHAEKESAEKKDADGKEAKEKGEAGEKGGEPAEVKLTPEMVKRFAITTYHVEPMVLREPIVAPGTVAFVPETTMHIGTVVLGRVAVIHAKLGDMVKAGDPLITIDSPELGLAQNDWLQKRASIAVAEADVGIAEKAHQRAQVLAKDSGISVGEAQRREGDFLKAQASLLAAKASVQAAENTLRIHGMDQAAIDALGKSGAVSTQLVIRAAAAGTVISSTVTLGEVVRPETESLMTLADTAHLVVIAQVPSSQASLVTAGSPVRITATSMPGKAIEGAVAYLSPQIDADTRTLSVRIPLAGDQGLSAGAFVQADISPAPMGTEKEPKIVAVPREAIFTVGGGTVVFVADDDHPGTYSMRKVAAAPALGSLVPIISGVEDDDEVVVHGGFIIKAEFGKAGAKDED
jgi:cobalt-zinc-cadmium efflux system membrane fusion protein